MDSFKNLVYWIFYKQPLERNRRDTLKYQHERLWHFTRVAFFAGWVVPWTGFALWYLLIVNGCESYSTREFLKGICIIPHANLNRTVPWYLDLWNSQADQADHSDSPPPYIENIMIGHLKVCDVETVLRQQILKIRETLSDIVMDDILADLYQVTAITSDLCLQLENFSRIFCLEKDIMNHAFRTFVEAYAIMITRSSYVDLSTSSLQIFPIWSHTLRLINQFTLIPFLPKPRLFSLQVKSEIRFQMKHFIDESTIALQSIDESCPSLWCSQNSTPRIFEEAIDSIDEYQQKLHQTIHNRTASTSEPQRRSEQYQALYALIERAHYCILSVKGTAEIYTPHLRKVKAQLQHLRQSFTYTPSFEFSPTGLIAVPTSLLEQIQDPSFLWRMQSLSVDQDSGTGGTPHSHIYHYDLDRIDDTRISTLRSAIAQLCRNRKNSNMVSGSLYMICNIWAQAVMMSELDYDTLGGQQKSWVVKRTEVIDRYKRRTGTDYDSVINLLIDTYRD